MTEDDDQTTALVKRQTTALQTRELTRKVRRSILRPALEILERRFWYDDQLKSIREDVLECPPPGHRDDSRCDGGQTEFDECRDWFEAIDPEYDPHDEIDHESKRYGDPDEIIVLSVPYRPDRPDRDGDVYGDGAFTDVDPWPVAIDQHPAERVEPEDDDDGGDDDTDGGSPLSYYEITHVEMRIPSPNPFDDRMIRSGEFAPDDEE